MLNLTQGEYIPDEEVIFDDGILYIIHGETYCRQIVLSEYDKPISLSEIAKRYPKVKKVIFDDAMQGYVFNYGNHKNETWECVGTTIGYA